MTLKIFSFFPILESQKLIPISRKILMFLWDNTPLPQNLWTSNTRQGSIVYFHRFYFEYHLIVCMIVQSSQRVEYHNEQYTQCSIPEPGLDDYTQSSVWQCCPKPFTEAAHWLSLHYSHTESTIFMRTHIFICNINANDQWKKI